MAGVLNILTRVHALKKMQFKSGRMKELQSFMSTMPSEHEVRTREVQLLLTEFNILLLMYTMNKDDGVISKDEKKLLKKHFQEIVGIANRDELKEMSKRLKSTVELNDIKEFCINNSINQIVANKGISLLRKINAETNRYSHVIYELEQNLNYHFELDNK